MQRQLCLEKSVKIKISISVNFVAKCRQTPGILRDFAADCWKFTDFIRPGILRPSPVQIKNGIAHCEGVFTRIHKYKQTIEKSVLDYVFISSDLEEYFTSMQIDEEKHFTPWRTLKHGKRYSDHCAIKFCMNMKAFEQKQASDKIKVWNFNNPEGWEKFNKLTEPSNIVSDMWQVGHHTEISYQKWQNDLNGILHLCFKKKRIQCNKGSIIRTLDSSLKRGSS